MADPAGLRAPRRAGRARAPMRKRRPRGGAASQRPRYYRQPEPGEQPLAPLPFVATGRAGAPPRACQTRRRRRGRRPSPTSISRTSSAPRLSNGIPVVYARRDRGAGGPGRGRVRRRHRRRSGQRARHPVADAEPARRRHDQPQLDPDRRGAGAARRRDQPGASLDRTAVTLAALTPNLGPSLDLLADIVRNPAFDAGRGRAAARAAARRDRPGADPAERHRARARCRRCSTAPTIPMAGRSPASATRRWSRRLTRDDLVRFHQSWIRPDNATIFVVGDCRWPSWCRCSKRASATGRPPAGAEGDQELRRRAAGAAGRGSS